MYDYIMKTLIFVCLVCDLMPQSTAMVMSGQLTRPHFFSGQG